MRLHPLRSLTIVVAFLLTASTLFAIPAASAQGPSRDFGAESGFLSSLNSQRAAGGLAPLVPNGSMTAAADGWAFSMASGSFLAHATAGHIIGGTPGGWTKVGENVGRGQTVTSLTTAFMSSPSHRANVMDASYTHIGIAVYTHPSDGRIYTTHRFAALPGAAPAPVVAAPVAAAAVPAATVPATPVPAAPVPTAASVPTAAPVPATPVPTATPVPATPVPTATPVPATPAPTATSVVTDSGDAAGAGFGTPPEQLAFIDTDSTQDAARAKRASKTAKFSG